MATAAIARSPAEYPAPQPVHWSLVHRIFLRFVCAYFLLYSLPGNLLAYLPGSQFLTQPYTAIWRTMCPWVGSHWFHLSGRAVTYTPTGSGDTTLDYIHNLLALLFACAATLLWSLLDRRRPTYRTLESWLRIFVRYTLAFTLFSYGFAKVFPLQFRAPGFSKLIEPYGDFSPMGALWYFMGASTPYIIFAGAAEVLPGLLLLFRRTATLGALIAFAVLLNVMALNFCYDVPVKLYSANLVLMSLYLASPDLQRLFNIFVLNRPTVPADHSAPRFSRRWARVAAIAFQALFLSYAFFHFIQGGWRSYETARLHPARPPIYGLYDVEQFTRNGQEIPPLLTDRTRWRKLIAEFPTNITIRMMNDSVRGYPATYSNDRVTLTDPVNKSNLYTLTYTRPDPDHLTLEGTVAGDRLSLRLRKTDSTKFLLVNRGFHWINEMPFNR